MRKRQGVIFGLRLKLFLLVLLGFGLLLSTILLVIRQQAEREANSTIEQSLEQAQVILHTALKSRFDDIYETAQGIASDGRVLPHVIDGDTITLADLSIEFQRALELDILMFTDTNGRVMARSDLPAATGSQLGGRVHLIDAARAGERAQGIMYSRDALHQVVAVPIRDNVDPTLIRGTLALAYRLSSALAEQIQRLTLSEVAFFAFDRLPGGEVVSTTQRYITRPQLGDPLNNYFAENPTLWNELLKRSGPGVQEIDLVLEGEHFHGLLYALERSGGGALGFIATLRSRDELLRPFQLIQHRVLLAGLFLLLIASALAWWIADSIASPIVRLTGVTSAIQDGQYPSGAPPRRRDEVGVLYRAVYQMSNTLREKAELEDYLAGVSEDWSSYDSRISLEGSTDLAALGGADATVRQQREGEGALEPTVRQQREGEGALEPTVRQQERAASSDQTLRVGSGRGDAVEVTVIHEREEADSASGRLAVGQLFADRYQISQLLGEGAMGSVYLAKDRELGEPVALKLIQKSILSADTIELFKSEIRLARRITHRNVVRTYDFGSIGDLQFISMEYVPGFTLGQLIDRRGALEVKTALMMTRQICSAIATAHLEGIVHRDLKPQNMMINRQGILKIMDFGLAMRISRPATATGVELLADSDQSQASIIAGTPNYMSLEQLQGDELDVRSDIYAIGVIMFYMLTGEVPYPKLSSKKRIALFETQPVRRVSELLNTIPLELDEIIGRAMAHRREQRFSSVRELQAELAELS